MLLENKNQTQNPWLEEIKEYIKALKEATPKNRGSKIIGVKQRGNNPGNWACQELAKSLSCFTTSQNGSKAEQYVNVAVAL